MQVKEYNLTNNETLLKNIIIFKEKLILKNIENLNVDNITKKEILKKIKEILTNSSKEDII